MAECIRCGACCAYRWSVWATVGDRIRRGHLAEWDGIEGRMVWRRKPWSRGHQVCIMLRQSAGGYRCPLHGTAEKPVDCQRFLCDDWLAACRVDPADLHFVQLADDFERFRDAWRAEKGER